MANAEIPSFGEALATFRTRAGLSQQQLAKQLGKNRRAVAAWEGGEYLPKAKGDVLELARILALNDKEATVLLKAAGIDPRLPIWNIPSPRNPFFTGREQELEQLHAQLQQGTTAAIGQMQSISGLGGIGKTQLAVEYAYRHQEEYQYVLWAYAENVEALTASFTEIANRLNLPEKNEQEQSITIQAVKRWLQRQRSWLLVLDNADNPALLPDFLPRTVGGHLLITTRAAEMNIHLAGLAHPLAVGIFSDEQGALFLLYRSGLLDPNAPLDQTETRDRQLALAIARELGGLPLALDQAGAYLKATGSSLVAYQQIYKSRRAQLLNERRGAEHQKPVATTWDISFRKVEQQNPAAADLLRLCAFLAPDAIPEEILTMGAEELGPILAPVAADAYLMNEVIESLRAYSLITRNPQAQTLTIHRLVQAVLRDSTPAEAQQPWMLRAVQSVVAAFPHPDFANQPTCEQLLPHVLACAIWIEQLPLTTPNTASLLNRSGVYLKERMRFTEAEPLLKQALAISERKLGKIHPDTASSLNNLAALYRAQGRYEEAEPLLVRALAISERKLGKMHPDTASSLNNLGVLYRAQGRYEEAEPLLVRALAIYEQESGGMHPNTASNLHNLADLYNDQGRYREAEPLLKRALAVREQQLGRMHPNTASNLNSLALLYWKQGRYREAEPLLKQALAIYEQELGAMHPDTASNLNNLAALYWKQGRYTEAEPLYQRALAISEQELGPMHPSTVLRLNNLAVLYYEQGKCTEAEPLYQRALAISEQELGPMHPSTVLSLNNLAALYWKLGRYAEAEPLYQRALAVREQQLGGMHPDTASSLNNLALLYWSQGEYTEAELLLKRALTIYEQELGGMHPDTANSLNNLAELYWAQGKYEQAESLYQHTLAICEQELGATHPNTVTSLEHLALLYESQDKYKQAEPLYQRALAIYEHQLGAKHPHTQTARENYAHLLQMMKP